MAQASKLATGAPAPRPQTPSMAPAGAPAPPPPGASQAPRGAPTPSQAPQGPPKSGSAEPVQSKIDDNISFTDTNAETMAGGAAKGANNTAMLELIGNLKKGNGGQSGSGERHKKRKHGSHGKTKMVQGVDRYESELYMMRIEGSVMCASLIMFAMLLAVNLIFVVVIILVTKNDVKHIFNTEVIPE